MFRRKKQRTIKHDSCLLVAPIQKGFPLTDFDVGVVDKKTYVFTGNAFGCVSAYRVPTAEEQSKRQECKESQPYLCYQLQKYDSAAVRHIWIQKDAETGVRRVYALIGFLKIQCWDLLDIFSSKADKELVVTQALVHPFSRNKPIEIFSIQNQHQLHIFAIGNETSFRVNCSVKHTKKAKVKTGWKLPSKTEVVSFDGKSYCFLLLDKSTGVKDLHCKDCETFQDIGSIHFPKANTYYTCFQHHGHIVAYVSNNNVVKIYDLKEDKVLYRLKGHRGYILAIHFDGTYVASLGTDKKIKLWKDGTCLKTVKNVPGVFNPGYLYKVMLRDRTVFYTADNGIFACCLPEDAV